MPKRFVPARENEQVRLRLLRNSDLQLTLHWRNQDHIRRWFFHSDLITPEQHARWFEQYAERDDDFVFLIEDVQAGYQPVGQVALYHVDWQGGRAEFGRLMIGEASAAGKGLAFAATQLILQIAFRSLGLREVYLEVYADNSRAVAIYTGAGFQVRENQDQVIEMFITPQDFMTNETPTGR